MQISKTALVMAAAILGALPLYARDADSDAQAKAREALRQKLNEAQTAPAQAAPATPAPSQPAPAQRPPATPSEAVPERVVPVPQAPAAQPEAAPNQPAARQTPQPSGMSAAPEGVANPDSLEIEKARQALHSKLNELRAQPQMQPQARSQSGNAPAAQPQFSHQTAAQHAAAMPQHKPAPAQKPVPAQKPGVSARPGKPNLVIQDTASFGELPRPDNPLSPAKQQQLADLLKRYEADEVTPEQYQAERAKILAQP
jgi:hypothetical protein